MDTMQSIREFFGWCTVLNFGMLVFASIMLMIASDGIKEIHGSLFGLSEEDLGRAYFQYLAQYKIAIFVFNLAPYVALRIMAAVGP